jgi:glycosyltransferase involved in cell wall biosynthesis
VKISIIVGNVASTGEGRWISRTFLIAEALQRNGHDVEILGYLFGESNINFSELSYPVYTFPGTNYPSFLRSIWRMHKKISGDIIYAQKLKFSSFGTALLHQKLTRKALILDIDDWELSLFGGESYRYQPSLRSFARDLLKPGGMLRNPDAPPYLQWIESQVKRADAVTIHTQFMRQRFGGSYLANGKNLELFNPDLYNPQNSRKKYGLDQFQVLMFPGAPRPYKGLEDVLEALDLLDWPDLRLVIVGGSPYDDYEQVLAERWPQRLINMPAFDYSQMPEVISAAHILVVPQRETSATLAQFPLKITDGMAMAKPVLASRVGDIPEILGDTGFVVPPSDPPKMAKMIEFIFGHWDYAIEQGVRARERCAEKYSIEGMAESLENVLASLRRVKR